MKAVLTVLLALQTACASSKIIRDHQYQRAAEAYTQQDLPRTIERFPEGEKNGFIPSVEKSWINLWQGEYNTKPLQKQIETFDERKFTSISREAGYFFTQESEEGYIPAEHEVVILHLISATQFHQLGNTEGAQVELRRASYLLDRVWDDPSLRVWLGTLWAAMGEWDHAQVDFRRANELYPNALLKQLASAREPQMLNLHFYGNGPVTKWNDGSFEPEFLEDRAPQRQTGALISTLPWFKRHTQRNTEIRDVLVKSNYMAQYIGSKALTGAEYGLTKSLTIGIRVIGIAVGAALLAGVFYLATQAGGASGDVLTYLGVGAVGVGVGIYKHGSELDTHLSHKIKEDDERKQRDLRTYRMVRFLPTWIGVSVKDDQPPARRIELKAMGKSRVCLVNHF